MSTKANSVAAVTREDVVSMHLVEKEPASAPAAVPIGTGPGIDRGHPHEPGLLTRHHLGIHIEAQLAVILLQHRRRTILRHGEPGLTVH